MCIAYSPILNPTDLETWSEKKCIASNHYWLKTETERAFKLTKKELEQGGKLDWGEEAVERPKRWRTQEGEEEEEEGARHSM